MAKGRMPFTVSIYTLWRCKGEWRYNSTRRSYRGRRGLPNMEVNGAEGRRRMGPRQCYSRNRRHCCNDAMR